MRFPAGERARVRRGGQGPGSAALSAPKATVARCADLCGVRGGRATRDRPFRDNDAVGRDETARSGHALRLPRCAQFA